MELPKKGEIVPLPKIKEICEHYGLHALWDKIEKGSPIRPFKSDGCSLWPDTWWGVNLYEACFLHDLKYWAGYPGEAEARRTADMELMRDVYRLLGSKFMARIIYVGIRLGSHEIFRRSFSWGFGRRP